jgi:hypothetical protein
MNMNNEPRQRLKSSSSIDANHIIKTNKSAIIIAKVPAILVAKELSDIVIYTQAIKFRGRKISSIFKNLFILNHRIGLYVDFSEFYWC